MSDLENFIADMKSRLEESENKCEHAYKTIQKLQDEFQIKQENIETKEKDVIKALADNLENKTAEISSLEEEKNSFRTKSMISK